MLKQRSELKYITSIKDSYGHEASALSGNILPSVDLNVSHSEYGDDASATGRENTFDRESKAFVTVSWTLFDGLGNHNNKARMLHKEQATNEELKATTEALTLQLRIALEDYQVSEEQLKVAKAAVGHANENYRVTELQFKGRVATITDLLDAHKYLTEAREDFNSSLYGLYESAATLDRVLERDFKEDKKYKNEAKK